MHHPKLKDRARAFANQVQLAKAQNKYPYFRPISRSWGTEVEVAGRRLIMIGSNDYLGLSHDPGVIEAASRAMRRWGTGAGGSRFLCGNMTLHEELEERLAVFVGKKMAVVHVTGFSTNLGAIASLLTPHDVILCDRENHASIFEGCKASRAQVIPFAHNNLNSAAEKLSKARRKNPQGLPFLITEGVFSMSGDMSPLPEFMELKKFHPELLIYLDDAHGLGVMGPQGRGTVAHFGVTDGVDFIMGTFSKALASIGGFIAGDDEDVLEYVRHHSKTLIFSAAQPACNAATVLACLDVIEREPERIDRLWEITRRARNGYQEIGLISGNSLTPIISIFVGEEEKAFVIAQDLFEHGIFALPAIFPAVPRKQAVIRTAFMSTHQTDQVDYVLEVLDKLGRKYGIRAVDRPAPQPMMEEVEAVSAPPVHSASPKVQART